MISRNLLILRDRIYTARHKAMVHALSGKAPYYVINEFPKSGGTWLSQMVSDALEIPFRRNVPIRVERAVVHGHFLRAGRIRNVVVLWRDPRDLIVSLYHHCYFLSEFTDVIFGNRQIVAVMKERLPFDDYDDVRANLPAFIDFISTHPYVPRYNWIDFAAQWANRPGTVQTRYETLRTGAAQELIRIVRELAGIELAMERAEEIAGNRSFAKAKAAAEAALPGGAERSFVREGSVGGWSAHFSDAAIEALKRNGYAKPMAKLGYAF